MLLVIEAVNRRLNVEIHGTVPGVAEEPSGLVIAELVELV